MINDQIPEDGLSCQEITSRNTSLLTRFYLSRLLRFAAASGNLADRRFEVLALKVWQKKNAGAGEAHGYTLAKEAGFESMQVTDLQARGSMLKKYSPMHQLQDWANICGRYRRSPLLYTLLPILP